MRNDILSYPSSSAISTSFKNPVTKRTTPHPLTPTINHSPTRQHPTTKTNAAIGLFVAAMLLQQLATVSERPTTNRIYVSLTHWYVGTGVFHLNVCVQELDGRCRSNSNNSSSSNIESPFSSFATVTAAAAAAVVLACARLGDEDAHNQGMMKSFPSRETNSRNESINPHANFSNGEN